MVSIETDRLVMKTNIEVHNGEIVFNKQESGCITIFNTKENLVEDAGFGFYLKEIPDTQVCHIGILMDRKPFEISYGTEKAYRGNGYMREAVKCMINWLFSNSDIERIYGLICENERSEKIILENGFKLEEINGKKKWYAFSRGVYDKLEKIE